MRIELSNIGRRFQNNWIFRGINHSFNTETPTVIVGPNGSGKSTLLQILSGQLSPSEGKINWENPTLIEGDNIYQQVSFCAPYIDLPQDFTLSELVDFHFKFKALPSAVSISSIPELCLLEKHKNKALRTFSSGMKQRVKLTLAILSNTPILLLDEPLSNLDTTGENWYREMITGYTKNKLVIVGSNHYEKEYFFCKSTFDLAQIINQ